MIIDGFVKATEAPYSFGKTRSQKYVSTSHLAEAAEQTLLGRHDIANDVLAEAMRTTINKKKERGML